MLNTGKLSHRSGSYTQQALISELMPPLQVRAILADGVSSCVDDMFQAIDTVCRQTIGSMCA